jgi:hypothetical protein
MLISTRNGHFGSSQKIPPFRSVWFSASKRTFIKRLVLADCVEKVGVQTGWGSDEDLFAEIRTVTS